MALRPDRSQSRNEQRKAAEHDVLLREVDEALRQDEMLGVFQRYGRPIAATTVLGLAALGGYLWWDSSREQAAAARGEQLTLALDQVEAGHLDAGDRQLFPLGETADAGTSAAARLMRGGVALQQGKPDAAVKQFAAVATDADAPQPFRDLATIREVAAAFDTLPPERIVARLKPLAVPGNPWFASAGELLGIAYLKQGKPALAGPLFAAIARDKDSPESLRARARQLAGQLGVDAIDEPEQVVARVVEPARSPPT